MRQEQAMAKQVRKPASTKPIGPKSVASERNRIAGTKPNPSHQGKAPTSSYKPMMLKPTKRG